MKKSILISLLALVMGISASAQNRQTVAILSVNDMHAAIEHFPRLAAIADSLRAVYPQLLVFSAGDNRTGNPISDLYPEPCYPMTALMNAVGFTASTLGNHAFDGGQATLANVINRSHFHYLCSNVLPPEELGIHLRPYEIFDVCGVRVGVLGVLQVNERGIPDCHIDKARGITFINPEDAIRKYLPEVREKSDVCILLSHIGYEEDLKMADAFPQFDGIIGGHSHTMVPCTMQNGVMITQTQNKLRYASFIRYYLEDGKIVGKEAELINVRTFPAKDAFVQHMVDYFSDNPELRTPLTTLEEPITTVVEMGNMVTDAWRTAAGVDFAISNMGGIRTDEHAAGLVTLADVLRTDPFANDAVVIEVTAKELAQMVIDVNSGDPSYGLPVISGFRADVYLNKDDYLDIHKVEVFDTNGKKLCKSKKYKVVTNSYVTSILAAPRHDQGSMLGCTSSDLLKAYLESQQSIRPDGDRRLRIIEE